MASSVGTHNGGVGRLRDLRSSPANRRCCKLSSPATLTPGTPTPEKWGGGGGRCAEASGCSRFSG